MAYLCREMQLRNGHRFPMVGVLPATARVAATPGQVQPIELTLSNRRWFGKYRPRVRGYYRRDWQFQRVGSLTGCVDQPRYRDYFVSWQEVVASRLSVNFAAQPEILDGLLLRKRPSRVTAS